MIKIYHTHNAFDTADPSRCKTHVTYEHSFSVAQRLQRPTGICDIGWALSILGLELGPNPVGDSDFFLCPRHVATFHLYQVIISQFFSGGLTWPTLKHLRTPSSKDMLCGKIKDVPLDHKQAKTKSVNICEQILFFHILNSGQADAVKQDSIQRRKGIIKLNIFIRHWLITFFFFFWLIEYIC